MKQYIELQVSLLPDSQLAREIAIAVLSDAGFESFFETDYGIAAYIDSVLWNKEQAENLLVVLEGIKTEFELKYQIIESVNWNKEWEKNFHPVLIENVFIRAPFHQLNPNAFYDLIIMPKMAFGTGHHHTTSMMIKFLLQTDCAGKKILDMGSGTGILAILSSKLGAAEIIAADNDEWAYNNCKENIELNNITNILAIKGSTDDIQNQFDIILANINKNILEMQFPEYARLCKQGGTLIISGFYTNDLELLNNQANICQFKFIEHKQSGEWVAACYSKL